jgi:hypothetical protein
MKSPKKVAINSRNNRIKNIPDNRPNLNDIIGCSQSSCPNLTEENSTSQIHLARKPRKSIVSAYKTMKSLPKIYQLQIKDIKKLSNIHHPFSYSQMFTPRRISIDAFFNHEASQPRKSRNNINSPKLINMPQNLISSDKQTCEKYKIIAESQTKLELLNFENLELQSQLNTLLSQFMMNNH